MGRNGYEVQHYCEILKKIIDFGSLPFGQIYICRYCKQELNAAINPTYLNDLTKNGQPKENSQKK
ncbi:MAG: hypothetical protein Q7R95_07590 [bacterium]|nr:hypothetical protein [bacterium]